MNQVGYKHCIDKLLFRSRQHLTWPYRATACGTLTIAKEGIKRLNGTLGR